MRLALGEWALLAALALVAGCTGDDSEKIYELTTGSYAVSDIEVGVDGCELDPVGNFSTQSVAVSGDTVSMGAIDLEKDGNKLEGEGSASIDQNPVDCILDFFGTGVGRVTGQDEFRLDVEVVLTVDSGTECGNAGITYPCSSQYSFRGAK